MEGVVGVHKGIQPLPVFSNSTKIWF